MYFCTHHRLAAGAHPRVSGRTAFCVSANGQSALRMTCFHAKGQGFAGSININHVRFKSHASRNAPITASLMPTHEMNSSKSSGELLKTPFGYKKDIQVRYSPATGEWNVSGKSRDSLNNSLAYVTYGTKRRNAYAIIEDSLNLRDTRIYDTIHEPDGSTQHVYSWC